MSGRIVRPADAAGLVLLRGSGNRTEVLMGRRSSRTRFMPGAYVFPGGRVDRTDARPSGFAEALPATPPGLDQATRRRALTFARAALRETFEETGLFLAAGTDAADRPRDSGVENHAVWSAYRRARLAPAFEALSLIARAITPTDSPIRFHARFFLADGRLAAGDLGGNGELVDLAWIRTLEVPKLPVADITELVLAEALARWDEEQGQSREPVLYSWSRQAETSVRRPGKGS